MSDSVQCPTCGEKYVNLANHWFHSPEHRPSFTIYQKDILTGLMMGDGTLQRSGKNPYLCVNMTSQEYLQHLSQIFGSLGCDVRLKKTALEKVHELRDSGRQPEAREENYSDIYTWSTRSHPELHGFDWYGGSQKVWPDNIDLSPVVLKHWFVGDGHKGKSPHIEISMGNEADGTDKVSRYFDRVDLPAPSNFRVIERGERVDCRMSFTSEDSYTLWEYMGTPLPGFDYKWPDRLKGLDN